MLRKSILVTSSWMALVAAASAADLPAVAAPVPQAIAPGWAGFYLGVHGGFGWGDNNFSQAAFALPPFAAIQGVKSQGGLYGAQAGYNWQFSRAVTGFEIDFSVAGISGNSATATQEFPGQGTLAGSRFDRVKYLGSTQGRLGWLPSDNFLLYGTAGAAWERIDQGRNFSVGPPSNLNVSSKLPTDRLGWVAGVGVETILFGSSWIGRLEYLHYDFGAVTETTSRVSTVPNASFSDHAGRQTIDTVRAALSYKFGAPGAANPVSYAKAPVVAAASGWAGFYLGAHGGYGWGENNFSRNENVVPLVQIGGPKLKGGVYGGHAGYNWQFGRTVTGLELDFSAADLKGSTQVDYLQPPLGPVTAIWANKVESLGSIRARLGWLPMDNLLLYGTAGLGWERLGRTYTRSVTVAAGVNTGVAGSAIDRFGWVAGAGIETMLPGGNWIGRLEYLHYGFGTVEVSDVETVAGVTTVSTAGNHGIDVLRAGLSYKFGEPAAAAPVRYAKVPAILPSSTSTWAGFYLGAHGGYGWKDNDFTRRITADQQTDGIKSRGWLAGGHAGYNWQYGRVVTGLETDFSFGDLKGTSTAVTEIIGGGGTLTTTLSDKVKYLATTRARLGWLPADNVLLYATGGLAWERLERTEVGVRTGPGARTDTGVTPSDRFGAVIGTGAEWMPFGPNWIGRVEYLHYDFGKFESTTTFTSTVPGAVPSSERQGRQTIEVVRAGVSYKFD
jgi:opacity protein-like surface antigen